MKKSMTLFRLFNNMQTKIARFNSDIAIVVVALVMSFFSIGEGAALPLAMPAIVDTTAYHPYPYIRFITERDSMKMTNEEFFDIAGKVIFPINKWTLPKRDSLIMQLEQEVFPLVNRDSLELVYMMLRGAASPEGPTHFNRFLGEKRAETLINFIKANLKASINEKFETEIDIEDYRTLCLMMRRMGDKDYGYVQAMCDQYLPKNQIEKLKSTLRTARQGTLWHRLSREYFPRLRAARIVFFFRTPNTYAPKVIIETPVEVVTPPVRPVKVEPVKVEPPVVEVVEKPVLPDTVVLPPVVEEVQPEKPQSWIERYPRRELLSVKTNMLLYGVYMPGYDRWCPIPNIALEYYPLRGHFTYGASFDCPWWQNYWGHKYFQVRNYQLEARYYFRRGDIELRPEGKGAAFKGWYLQAYGNATLFGICFDENRGWVGEGGGGGLGFGYVLPLSKKGHWRLEFQLQAGFFFCVYDPYQFENPVDPTYRDHLYYYKWEQAPSLFKKRQYRSSWIGPTRVGITLSYDLLYRKARKKTDGVWFPKDTEPTKHYNPLVPYEKERKEAEND